MIGHKCDYCSKFAPMAIQVSMFGSMNPVTPAGWIQTQEEKPAPGSSLFGITTADETPAMPVSFCSPNCVRDYYRARTLIEGS